MRLKSIEMQGFKSFPDRTVIEFEHGVTAIIGPNGSGKSNISDAVRWVLGEMSAKNLRGGKLEDVLFNGAAGRKESSYVYVTLCLDTEEEYNKKSLLTVEDFFTSDESGEQTEAKTTPAFRIGDDRTVSVTRKYYRTGESEYYINKTQVRLKDIYELFYNTGIGREGYSIIGQGKISEVLSQKGDERRNIFEEAAGISKYRHKKTEAERKLRETELNLVRVGDILSEVSQRIGPLEKEAEDAKEYLFVSEEKKKVEITLWLDGVDAISEDREGSKKLYEDSAANLRECEEKSERKEKELDELINGNYNTGRLISEHERSKTDREREIGEVDARIAVKHNEIFHKNTLIETGDPEIASLEEKIASCEAETQSLDTQLAKTAEAIRQAEEKREDISLQLQTLSSQIAEGREKALAKDAEMSSMKVRLAQLAAEADTLESSVDELSESRNDFRIFVESVEAKIKEIEEAKRSFVTELENREAALSEIAHRREELDNQHRALSENIRTLKEAADSSRMEAESLKHKKDNLERMEKLLEGYPESVKRVISDAKEGKIKANGKSITVHGTVSSLISSDDMYVTAIETSLGAAVQYVVTESSSDAKAAIQYLKTNKYGRATFLPIETIKGRKADTGNIKDCDGYIGLASELTTVDGRFAAVVEDLLGRTVIASDLDKASEIAKKSGYRIKIVTLDGQVINAGGSFTGGSSTQKTGLLTRSRDIASLAKQIKEKQAETERAVSLLNKNEQDLTIIDALVLNAESELSELSEAIAGVRIKIGTADAELAAERRSLESYKNDADKGNKSLVSYRESIRIKRAEAAALETDISGIDSVLQEMYAEIADIDGERADKSALIEAGRKHEYELRAESDRIASQRRIYENSVQIHTQRIYEIKASISEAACSIESLEADLADLSLRREGIIKAGEEDAAKLESLYSDREARERKINAARSELKDIQSEKEELVRVFTTADEKRKKLEAEYEEILTRLWDEYELTYSDAQVYRLENEKYGKLKSRLSSLKSKIKSMGAINVNAVEEYREEKARFDFLTVQTDDLKKTRKSLDNAINKLDLSMKQAFLDSFVKINRHFGELFTVLFGGGSAYLELTDPEQPLDCGIDIILKPPGKNVKNISQLSGGEQAFAAIALYIALQKVNPSPFCIFDEIESALDDVNLARFADYIRENSKETQYILITHRRGTMERADTLYGVTMKQKGVSDYIKLDISQMEKNIKKYASK